MAGQNLMPSFKRPPLGEVVLALQFENLNKLDVRHAGALAGMFADRFPEFAAHAPLDPVVENFDGLRIAQPMTGFQLADVPLFPRLWFINQENSELVQLQRDWLMHNWRSDGLHGTTYPRYPSLRSAFAADWNLFEEFVRKHALGELLPTQCEVTYINHVNAESTEGQFRHPSEIFSFISPTFSSSACGQFEALTHSSTFRVSRTTPGGESLLGRLYVQLNQGITRHKSTRIYQLSLLLRGAPPIRNIQGVLQFFDFAREHIVNSFVKLTTPKMHNEWGLEP